MEIHFKIDIIYCRRIGSFKIFSFLQKCFIQILNKEKLEDFIVLFPQDSVPLLQKIKCYLLSVPTATFMFCPAPICKSKNILFSVRSWIGLKLRLVAQPTNPSINALNKLLLKDLYPQTTVNFIRKASIGYCMHALSWQKACRVLLL